MTGVTFKNARIVRSSWLDEGGRRLDCNPYMSGALEARDTLLELSVRKDELRTLTSGHGGGIYNGPMFRRNYVESAEHGVPFLSSGSMMLADQSNLPLLRRKDAESSRLAHLRLMPGTTLISCSGTIGRMCYVRPDMEGVWSSQDVLKVVPDEARIPSGYLYAFLSGKYGVPLVVSGTYGAIIQHIEAEHIAELPVPRFSDDLESKVHSLVDQAAKYRAEASALLRKTTAELLEAANLPTLLSAASPVPFSTAQVSASLVQPRFDAFFHSEYRSLAVRAIERCGLAVDDVNGVAASVEEPNRFKRIVLDGESGGVPLFGTSTIYWSDPELSYFLPKKLAAPYVVSRRTVLVPRSGQLSGVIGRPVLPYGDIIGAAVSEDAIRVNCRTEVDAGVLFLFLSSEYGIRQLKARAFGSSIPHLDVRQIGACLVPKLPNDIWEEIGTKGLLVSDLRGRAIVSERRARLLVEEAISEGRS
jgi:type I restriction enzyme S subunit